MAQSLQQPLLQSAATPSADVSAGQGVLEEGEPYSIDVSAVARATPGLSQGMTSSAERTPVASPGVTPRFGKQEILEGLETGEVPAQLQSDFQTVMNTVNLYVGAGLLSMPYAMKIGGWIGLVVLGLCAAMSCTTGHFISFACDALPSGVPPSYPALGKAAFGPPGEWILLTSVMLEFWGALSMCLIIVWRSLAIVFGRPDICVVLWGGTSWCLATREAVVLLTLAVAVPVILIRSFSRLTSVALSGVFSSAVLCTVVITAWSLDPSGALLPSSAAHEHSIVNWQSLPVAAGIFIVSLSGHAGLPSLRRGMKNPAHFPACLRATFLCIFLLYATMALFGYLYFGDSAQVLVTSNLDESGSLADVTLLHWGTLTLTFSQVLSLLVAMSVFTTVPALVYVLGEILTDFIIGADSRSVLSRAPGPEPQTSWLLKCLPREGWEMVFRLLVLATGYLLASFCYDYLARLESLVGGILSMTASLILPSLVFYSLSRRTLRGIHLYALRTFILLVMAIPPVIVYFNLA